MIIDRQSQVNIPEGMIPQEVVVRNRNRFLHNERNLKKSNSESKPEIKNESPAKDDDSDDGYRYSSERNINTSIYHSIYHI